MERLNFSDTSGFNKLSIGDTIVWVKENRIHGWDITSVFLKVINVTVPQNGFFKNQIGNVKVQLGNNQICDLFFYNGYNRTYTVSNDVRGYARHVSGLGKRMECIGDDDFYSFHLYKANETYELQQAMQKEIAIRKNQTEKDRQELLQKQASQQHYEEEMKIKNAQAASQINNLWNQLG